ncbi:PAS domain-containing sensor histidine kinase [Malaciobacter molluscorum LMG 25693]|uniref:histidine kinase n=1 Tax=Malaciobacter molluscorum LMG 25693 TaxID=870501 RepID=A0A2G1DI56_9BACT|nr:PAS domain S-box protein [Malaciobacter molluscorum]AXX92386.1 PAS sensor-containing two-component system histidine kinase [Malaciobacter molluscorum LMG 25693]PHO18165.1 PAS domain-containing sensor histidine kinase [Malaciobacter molluscorum LMG 25693]RXJ93954.1 PAS domain-containing sensor histidine kinase [Malaciobacter molluscorum]
MKKNTNTYQQAIENSNIVSKTDINGIITFVNDEFCKISGYTKEELLGKNHNIVRHPDVPKEHFKLLWETIKLKRQTYKSTVKNLTKDGRSVYLNTTISPIFNEFDDIEEFIAIRYDVTQEVELKKDLEKKDKELKLLNKTLEMRVQEQTKQLKELNQNLEQRVEEEIEKNKQKQKILFWQSRMASLGQMLANIAHQWRQPLTELNLALFNMKKAAIKNEIEEISKYYKDSKEIIANMSQTIDDFSNFFNPNKEKKKFDLKIALEESLNISKKLIQKENIVIKKDYIDVEVFGVSNEFSQVIINFLQNSAQAFNKNNVKNRLINIQIKKITQENNHFAQVLFLDNALGVNEKTLDKIFEPYFTTKHQSNGTGLGLFMSKMIIEKSLNGNILAQNFKNGLLFTINLPL